MMSKLWLLQCFFCVITFTNSYGQSSDTFKLINTPYGVIRGKVDTQTKVPVAKFFGIPYARPPVGSLRFKPPLEPEIWNYTRDAFDPGKICMQQTYPNYLNETIDMGEDCLLLHVYMPVINNTKEKLPVMMWIHEGGYVVGNGAMYDGTSLAQAGVIYVTINYRLDAFGFLSTEDSSMPGNYGMLDQIEALKWIQKNIPAFGGDPNKVTIFGQSAGGGSVSLLMMSPLAKNLFQRAILQSGVSLSPFTITRPGYRVAPKAVARLVATSLGCPDIEDTSKMLTCLQAADSEELLKSSVKYVRALDSAPVLAPRVEQNYNFLPDLPINLLTKGRFTHVDTLRGFNTNESGMYLYFLSNQTSDEDQADKILRLWIKMFNEKDQEVMYKLMKDSDLAQTSGNSSAVRHAAHMGAEFYFIAPTIAELNIMSQMSPEVKHFLYQFNHRPSYSRMPAWMNATHRDEVPFVFGIDSQHYSKLIPNPTSADISVSRQMVEMWTDFAKTGDPSTTWSSYSPASPNYLYIDTVSDQMRWYNRGAADFYVKMARIMTGYKPENRSC